MQLEDRKQKFLDQVVKIDESIETWRKLLEFGENKPAETKTSSPKPTTAESASSGVRKGKSSQFKGVKKEKKSYADGRPRFTVNYHDRQKGKIKYLGTFDNEYLAAAKYQDHIGNKKEAKRLRSLAKQQRLDMAEQAENNPDRPTKPKMKKWKCKHCGLEVKYPTKPKIGCIKCNNSAYEQIA